MLTDAFRSGSESVLDRAFAEYGKSLAAYGNKPPAATNFGMRPMAGMTPPATAAPPTTTATAPRYPPQLVASSSAASDTESPSSSSSSDEEHYRRRRRERRDRRERHRRRKEKQQQQPQPPQQQPQLPQPPPAPPIARQGPEGGGAPYYSQWLFKNPGEAAMTPNAPLTGNSISASTLGPPGPCVPQNPPGFMFGTGSQMYASGIPNNGMPEASLMPGNAGLRTEQGDPAGHWTDPITGITYEGYTARMPDPLMMKERPVYQLGAPNRELEALSGVSSLPPVTRQEHFTEFTDLLEGATIPESLLAMQARHEGQLRMNREIFLTNKEVPCGINDRHPDGYIGDYFALRPTFNPQTQADNDSPGMSYVLNTRPVAPDVSVTGYLYRDGTEWGGPMQPRVRVLAQDKPTMPGRRQIDVPGVGEHAMTLPVHHLVQGPMDSLVAAGSNVANHGISVPGAMPTATDRLPRDGAVTSYVNPTPPAFVLSAPMAAAAPTTSDGLARDARPWAPSMPVQNVGDQGHSVAHQPQAFSLYTPRDAAVGTFTAAGAVPAQYGFTPPAPPATYVGPQSDSVVASYVPTAGGAVAGNTNPGNVPSAYVGPRQDTVLASYYPTASGAVAGNTNPGNVPSAYVGPRQDSVVASYYPTASGAVAGNTNPGNVPSTYVGPRQDSVVASYVPTSGGAVAGNTNPGNVAATYIGPGRDAAVGALGASVRVPEGASPASAAPPTAVDGRSRDATVGAFVIGAQTPESTTPAQAAAPVQADGARRVETMASYFTQVAPDTVSAAQPAGAVSDTGRLRLEALTPSAGVQREYALDAAAAAARPVADRISRAVAGSEDPMRVANDMTNFVSATTRDPGHNAADTGRDDNFDNLIRDTRTTLMRDVLLMTHPSTYGLGAEFREQYVTVPHRKRNLVNQQTCRADTHPHWQQVATVAGAHAIRANAAQESPDPVMAAVGTTAYESDYMSDA